MCFLANAVSFAAVLAALARISPSALHPGPPAGRESGQLRQGLHYVRHTPGLLMPLLMMALVGTFAYEFQVSLLLLARISLRGGASACGFLTAAMGVGAVAGRLVVAALWPGSRVDSALADRLSVRGGRLTDRVPIARYRKVPLVP